MIRIYGDFNKWANIGDQSYIILTTRGTFDDLQKLGIELEEGMQVMLYSDDVDENGLYDELEVDAVIRISERHGHCWVGVFDSAKIRHASDRLKSSQLE